MSRQFVMPVKSKNLLILLLLMSIGFTTGASTASEWSPEFPVGTPFPELSLADQQGNQHTLKTLMGRRGMLLLFTRSAVW